MTYRYLEQKKWNLFDIVGAYSSGVKLTLKVGLVPMETTPTALSFANLCLSIFFLQDNNNLTNKITRPECSLINACFTDPARRRCFCIQK